MIASVIAGLLWDRVDAAAPFWFGATAALAAIALLLLTRPWRSRVVVVAAA